MGQIDDTFGAWFIGHQVATIFYGVSILQTWLLVQRWANEPPIFKYVVSFLLITINYTCRGDWHPTGARARVSQTVLKEDLPANS